MDAREPPHASHAALASLKPTRVELYRYRFGAEYRVPAGNDELLWGSSSCASIPKQLYAPQLMPVTETQDPETHWNVALPARTKPELQEAVQREPGEVERQS
jgi:hypothetical protein